MPHGHPANAYRTVVPPTVGLRASSTHTVTEADTAINQGSGEVPVLATPRLVALFEQTTLTALAGHQEADQDSPVEQAVKKLFDSPAEKQIAEQQADPDTMGKVGTPSRLDLIAARKYNKQLDANVKKLSQPATPSGIQQPAA